MDVFLTLKGHKEDSFYFTSPFLLSNSVSHVYVFRDEEGIENSKVSYVVPKFQKPSIIRLIIRLFQMIKQSNKKVKAIIGFYEIPHGLLAFIAGKILNKKSIVCIISNPSYEKIRKGWKKKVLFFLAKKADAITTTGSISRQYFITNGINPDKIFILPNSIDTAFFKPNHSISKKYDIGTLSRLSYEKNILVFIEIVKRLKEIYPNIKAAIGGSGPEKQKIIDKIEELGLSNNIEMLGFIKEHELPEFLNSIKVFVSTSETEGFPRTIIESMACGTPCVSSNVGDISDLITNEKNGFLIEKYDDIKKYVDKTRGFLNHEFNYPEFSKNCIEDTKKMFSHESALETWNKIFIKTE